MEDQKYEEILEYLLYKKFPEAVFSSDKGLQRKRTKNMKDRIRKRSKKYKTITENGVANLVISVKSRSKSVQILFPEVYRIYPKKSQVTEIIERIHADNGHPGILGTINKIRSAYYWKGLTADVIEFCKKCNNCHKTKHNFNSTAPLRPILSSKPEERIIYDGHAMDKDDEGNNRIIGFIDNFSLRLQAFPVKSNTVSKDLVVKY
jgi:hypothetical protein